MNTWSLNKRIILSAVFVLIIFITLTATALNKAFNSSAKNSLKDTITTQLYALIATAEVDIIDKNLIFNMPSDDLDSLFGLPNSGLTAQVIDEKNHNIWQSESFISASAPSSIALKSGEKVIQNKTFNNKHYLQMTFGTSWIINNQTIPLTFIVNQDLKAFNQQLDDYSTTLWLWLGAMALFLIVSQIFILRWGLKPINTVVDELHQIEQGKQDSIIKTYPKEIEVLSSNINHLLANEHAQKTRYRNALGDLAHSLKTPLAVIQSSINNQNTVSEQINNMNTIVEYQLQKAATAGSNHLAAEIDIKHIIKRIIDSMLKVYVDKNIEVNFTASEITHYKADEGDMMELFGNLIDNAFKWANSQITIDLKLSTDQLIMSIEDDGPGFPIELIDEIKQRGKRADESTPGHGIGLSIVNNIVDSYAGNIFIANSSQNQGALIKITI